MSDFTPNHPSDITSASNPASPIASNIDTTNYHITSRIFQPSTDQQDAYILQPILVASQVRDKEIRTNATICFGLQRYHYDEHNHQFTAILLVPAKLCLHVTRYFHRRDHNHALPYQLDGYLLNATNIAQRYQDDPILSQLQATHRLTFRYDPHQSTGCLVHIGLDLAPYDGARMALLWRSALNCEQAKQQANTQTHARQQQVIQQTNQQVQAKQQVTQQTKSTSKTQNIAD